MKTREDIPVVYCMTQFQENLEESSFTVYIPNHGSGIEGISFETIIYLRDTLNRVIEREKKRQE